MPLWAVVAVACVGQFLVVLDVSVVNVALASVRTDLDLSATGLQWVVNAYTLTFAGLLLLGGRAGDLFGRKRMFLVGLALFTIASLAGGLAQASWQLFAARAMQGVGAAVLAPSSLTLLTTNVPEGPARTRAVATWTAVGAGGGAAGALIGGVLTDALSWRWVLLVNVPVGALVLTAAAFCLTESHSQRPHRLDLVGAVLVTSGLAAITYAIVQTEAEGWAAPITLTPLLGGFALIGVFLFVEARAAAPLMPLALLGRRPVAAANAAMFICGGALVCSWYFISLVMQTVLGFTALQTGLGFVPLSLAAIAGAKLAPRLMERAGARNLAVAGVLTAIAGYLWLGALDPAGSYATTILGPGVVTQLGVGLLATPLASIATSETAFDDAGLASGLVNAARTMGGSIGLAALASVAAAHTGGSSDPQAVGSGYALAFHVAAVVLVGSVLLILTTLPGRPVYPPAIR